MVNNTVTAGTSSGDISICSSDNLTEQNLLDTLTGENAGGTWTDDGSATVTFPINTAGTYTYTVVGTGACAGQTDSESLTVLVNNTVTAGTSSGDISICSSDNLTEQNLLDTLTDENPGGTWTDSGGATVTFPINTAGAYTYTVVGTGACADQTDSESLTVLVNNTVTAGTSSGDISICSSDNLTEQDLLDTLTDENAGGTWTDDGGATVTFPINTAGTYTYTVVGTGACAGQTDSESLTVLVNNTVTAGTSSGDISICSSDNLTEQNLLDTLPMKIQVELGQIAQVQRLLFRSIPQEHILTQ